MTLMRELESSDADRVTYPPDDLPTIHSGDFAAPRFLFEDRQEMADFSIANFKAIESLSAIFPELSSSSAHSGAPCLMILGENSTGKSSILSAVALALIGTRHAPQYRKHLSSLVSSRDGYLSDQLDEKPIFVRIGSHSSFAEAEFMYDPRTREISGTRDPACVVLGYGPRRFFDPKRRIRPDGMFSRINTLFDSSSTIPYPSDWLRTQVGRKFDETVAALRIILALDDEDEVLVRPDHLAVRANGRITAIDQLSEGYRSVFAMTVDMIREFLDHWTDLERATGVVLIDEIETHLHPRWKMQVMSSLRRVFPRVQFIATTHDPLCLRGMDDDEVMLLRRDADRNIEVVPNLPSVRGMTSEQLLLSDYFGLSSTADPNVELELAQLAGDVVATQTTVTTNVHLSRETLDTIGELTIGDSLSEMLMQEALMKYLSERQDRKDHDPVKLRQDAVRKIIRILKNKEGSDAKG